MYLEICCHSNNFHDFFSIRKEAKLEKSGTEKGNNNNEDFFSYFMHPIFYRLAFPAEEILK